MLEKEKGSDNSKRFSKYKFGERFKGCLETADKEELTKKLGVSSSAFRQWANGYTLPTCENLMVISEHFGVSSDYLLGLTDVPAKKPEVREICEYMGLSEEALLNLKFALNSGTSSLTNAGFYKELSKYDPSANIPAEINMGHLLNFAFVQSITATLRIALRECVWSEIIRNAISELDLEPDPDNMADCIDRRRFKYSSIDRIGYSKHKIICSVQSALEQIAQSYLATYSNAMRCHTTESANREIEQEKAVSGKTSVKNMELRRKYNKKIYMAYSKSNDRDAFFSEDTHWRHRVCIDDATEDEYVAWLDSQIKDGDTNA